MFPRGDGFISNFFGEDFFGGGGGRRHRSRNNAAADQLAMQRSPFGALDLFDAAGFGGGMLSAPADDMMMFGPNMFRGIDDMMSDLQRHTVAVENGAGSSALASLGGDGTFHSQVMVMSQTIGPDGQVKTKKYAHTDIGDSRQGIREVRQAYADDAEQRALHFQQMNERSHWRQSCKNLQSGEVDTRDDVRGFDRSQLDRFQQDWTSTALPRVQTVQQSRPALGGVFGSRAAALPPALPRGSFRSPFTLASSQPPERHGSVQRQPYIPGAPTPYVCEESGSSMPTGSRPVVPPTYRHTTVPQAPAPPTTRSTQPQQPPQQRSG